MLASCRTSLSRVGLAGQPRPGRLQWPRPGGHLPPNLCAQATPRPRLHPGPLLLPGLTPASRRLTWPPPWTPRCLRCLLLSGPRGPADLPRSTARGHRALHASGHCPLCPSLTRSQVWVTATRARGSDHCSSPLVPFRGSWPSPHHAGLPQAAPKISSSRPTEGEGVSPAPHSPALPRERRARPPPWATLFTR